jgi:transposase
MGAIIQGAGASELRWDAQRIVICLSRQVFGTMWDTVVRRLTEAWQAQRFFVWTQPAMIVRGSEPDAPRWKVHALDVLSGMLFLLKVPADHELVRLWAVIDWSAINAVCAPLYHNAHGGPHAWAPAQMIALLVLMFLYGVGHETTLLRRVQENIVWCWFCGVGLFGPWPNHSTLYTFRQRLGVEVFEQVLTIAVQACIEAGLVANALVHFDLTAMIASGHRWSPYERATILSKALIRYLELVWAEQAPEAPFPEALRLLAAQVALEVLPHKSLSSVSPERVVQSVADWDRQTNPEQTTRLSSSKSAWQGTLEEAVRDVLPPTDGIELLSPTADGSEQSAPIKPWLSQIAKCILGQLPHTRGDQDARVGRTTSYTWFCGYLMGFVVDGLHHIITAVAWGVGNVKQALLFRPALRHHLQRVPGRPKGAAIDSAFDHPDVYACLDAEGIEGHITSRDHAQPRDGGFGTDCLVWHTARSEVFCPNGTPLRPQGDGRSGRQLFVGTGCVQCALYARCHPSGEGEAKTFTLDPVNHRRWQQNREHCRTGEYKVAQKARFVEEGRFGLAKMNHGADKAPYRSDQMNHIAGLMIAAVMDWRVLARHQPSVLNLAA